MRGSLALTLLLLCACATGSSARQAAAPGHLQLADSARPVDRQAADVCLGFEEPARITDHLAPSFVAKIPVVQVEAILGQLHSQLGRCLGVQRTEGDAHVARYQLRFESGHLAPLAVSLDARPPHRIVGLWIGNPVKGHESLEAIVEEMRTLPGQVDFLVADLEPAGVAPRIALESEERLAIGSAFKLYVLAELVRAVEAGERAWDEVVPLGEEAISLPSGKLQRWPVGAPLTLHTLATLMISESDNTATDQLILALGRERIEAMLETTGHGAPGRNVPFLTTREAFLLKGEAGEAWAAADEARRRQILEEELPALDPGKDAPRLLEPTRIAEVEWFASGADLAGLYHWLLERMSPELRGVLAVNPGFDSVREGRRWVGFKGGSEPGVLNLSFLLENDDGSWQVLIATWNDPSSALEETRFLGLVERALTLLAASPTPAS